jgi:hypothetical protein
MRPSSSSLWRRFTSNKTRRHLGHQMYQIRNWKDDRWRRLLKPSHHYLLAFGRKKTLHCHSQGWRGLCCPSVEWVGYIWQNNCTTKLAISKFGPFKAWRKNMYVMFLYMITGRSFGPGCHIYINTVSYELASRELCWKKLPLLWKKWAFLMYLPSEEAQTLFLTSHQF